MYISDIELYFETFGTPSEDIEIIPGVYVLCEDAEFFISQTLNCLKAHPLNNAYKPYYLHLLNYFKAAKKINDNK